MIRNLCKMQDTFKKEWFSCFYIFGFRRSFNEDLDSSWVIDNKVFVF